MAQSTSEGAPVGSQFFGVPAEVRPHIEANPTPQVEPPDPSRMEGKDTPPQLLSEQELLARVEALNVIPETMPTDSAWFRAKHGEIVSLWQDLLLFHVQVEGRKKGTPDKIHQAMHTVAIKVNSILELEMQINVREAMQIAPLVHDLNDITDRGIEDLTNLPSTR